MRVDTEYNEELVSNSSIKDVEMMNLNRNDPYLYWMVE